MSISIYEQLFPHVSFTDKVCVVFKDGTEKVFKHLYHDKSELDDVNWVGAVRDCFEL